MRRWSTYRSPRSPWSCTAASRRFNGSRAAISSRLLSCSSERLAGRAHWSQGSLPLVLLCVHALLSPVRLGLVGERADRISSSPGHERRSDGADGADDDGTRCRKTYGAHHRLRG